MNSNLSRAQPGWPPAIIAGGFITGVVLMRNLHQRGVDTYCIDWNRRQPAFRTVYGKTFQCPSADDYPADWLRFMVDLAGKIGGRPVLIPSSDQYVTAIAQHAAELEKHFIFCHSSAAVQGLLATKKRQYDIAGDHGLPVPRTRFVSSADEVREFADTARFPCILKPLHFREWKRIPPDHPLFEKKLIVVQTPEELARQYDTASKINPEMVLQEMIEGPDTAKLVYLSCYSQKAERIASCLVRQIRTDPIYFGSASVVEPVADPETEDLCDRFLRSLNYVGLCEIELKRDSRDGRVKMIEANPRYSVTADAAPYMGVDLGWLHYLDLIGEAVTPVAANGRQFRHIVLFRDFATARSYHREGLMSWGQWLRSYRPPVAFFDFDIRDWRVALSTLITLARLVAGPPLRRIFPKRRPAAQ